MLGPARPTPVSQEVADGLIGTRSDFKPTGTSRQGRPEYRTQRAFWYKGHTIPAGFVFDIHSLPRVLRPWQPKSVTWWGPPLLHDWLLESGSTSLKEANKLYLQAMRDIGVSPQHRFVAYRGVEIGRRLFADRVSRIDPDNIELISSTTGRQSVINESTAARRKTLFHAVKRIGELHLKSRGI